MVEKKDTCIRCGALIAAGAQLCPPCAGDEKHSANGDDEPTPIFGGGRHTDLRRESTQSTLPVPEGLREIAGHKILRKLGRGGTSEVFLAREPLWNREVALKIVLPDLEPRLHKQFVEEAYITGQLQHPAIVPIYRVGQADDGRDWYTMKRVQGRTLAEIIRSLRSGNERDLETYNLRRRAALMSAVCEGVAYAHDHGVVHRDLKPGNIMIGDYNEVYILDWGLAKMLFGRPDGEAREPRQWDADLEQAGMLEEDPAGVESGRALVSGTPAYMSPEQARGETKVVDRRSDVWSLGAVFFQLLTLQAPVQGATPQETLRNVASAKRFRLDDLPEGRNVPTELAHIVERSLQANPDKRYPDAHGPAADLRAYLEGLGRWREAYRVRFRDQETFNRDWTTLLGAWEVDKHGLHPLRSPTKTAGSVCLLRRPIPGDVRIELRGRCNPPAADSTEHGELSVFLCAPAPGQGRSTTDGYCFQFGADYNTSAKLAKDNVDIAVRTEVGWKPQTPHRLTVERIGNRLRFEVDGRELFSFVDLFPLSGDHIGIYGFGSGGGVEELRVFSRGLDANVSCLAVPDHDFNRKRYDEALEGYRRIAEELSGREEGRMARYKAGLSLLAEEHSAEALKEFALLDGTPGEVLAHLGRALLCERQNDWKKELERLDLAARLGRGSSLQAFVLAHLWTRALFWHRKRHQEAAIAFYQTILRTDSHGGIRVAQALRRVCRDLLDLGRDEEALRYLEQLGLESPRERPEVLQEALRYLIQRGRWDDAMAAALALKETASARPLAYSFLARNFIYRRLWEVAERYIDDGLVECGADSPSPELLRLKAWLKILRGNPAGALSLAEEPSFVAAMRKADDSAAEALLWREWAATLRGDAHANERLRLEAENVKNAAQVRGAAWCVLSRRASLRGQIKEAREHLHRAFRVQGFSPTSFPTVFWLPFLDHLHLGEALLCASAGDFAGAESLLRIFVRGDPRLPNRFLDRTVAETLLRWDGGAPVPELPAPGPHCPIYGRAAFLLFLAEWADAKKQTAIAAELYRRTQRDALSPYDFPAWVATIRLRKLGFADEPGTPPFAPF